MCKEFTKGFIFSLVCSQDRSTVVFKPIYYVKAHDFSEGGILCYAKELIRHENLRLPVVLVFTNLCVTLFAFIINQTGREIYKLGSGFELKNINLSF